MSKHAPTTQLSSTTDLVRMGSRLHRIWVAYQSAVDPHRDRGKCTPLEPVAPRDRLTDAPRVKIANPEIAAYLERIGAG